jgi:nitrite reductase (NADH) small subunit
VIIVTQKIEIGNAADIVNKTCHVVEIKGRSIALFNVGEHFYGILNVCPHKGAPLCHGSFNGTMLPSSPNTFIHGLEDRVIRCPWHGYEFDVTTGEALFGIIDSKVKTYEVTEEDGILYIEM